jgi:hypothetical protein
MKKLLTFLFVVISLGLYAQNDLPNNCLDCATAQGFYCGEDPSNWTVYSPNGCVPSFYINDGYEDCVDASDEGADVIATTIEECPEPIVEPCDTVYVDVIQYETIWEIMYDTVYVDVIEYEYIYETIFDTIIQTEYETIFDTVVEIEYEEIFTTEYIDCDTGLPCTSGMEEILDKSIEDNRLFNLNGQIIREPNGVYIEGGKIKYKFK